MIRHRHLFCSVVMMFLLSGLYGWAQEEYAEPAAPIAFILHPVQEGFSVIPVGSGHGAEVSFKKEPAYAGGQVLRKAIQFGNRPADFIGVAYDVAGNALYVDHNLNLDLTDDGPAVTGGEAAGFMSYASFSDVAVTLDRDGMAMSYVLDLTFYGGFFFDVTVKSGWRGEGSLGGTSVTMGIADNLDGRIDASDVFTFDHQRLREARLDCGRVEGIGLPDWFWFEGQAYRIAPAFRVVDDAMVVAVALTPITDDLMDIAFDGQFVSRILLQDSRDQWAMLDWPDAAMSIPVGQYTLQQVDLLDSFTGHPRPSPTIAAGGNTLLKAGGPLNQKVRVSRSGAYLDLQYSLVGADDDTLYRADAEQENPTFAVYKGDSRVGAGQFEYG